MIVVVKPILEESERTEEIVYRNVKSIAELTYEDCLNDGADLSEENEADLFFRLYLDDGKQATFNSGNWNCTIV